MSTKLDTMKLGAGDYAKVATRLKQFREDCPRGSIETKPTIENDTIIFSTTIIKDLSDEYSARATGTAFARLTNKAKEFEKTESISVGRALALLGYLASGDIASSEEMEDFLSERELKKKKAMEVLAEKLESIKTVEELRVLYPEYKGKGKELEQMITDKSKEL